MTFGNRVKWGSAALLLCALGLVAGLVPAEGRKLTFDERLDLKRERAIAAAAKSGRYYAVAPAIVTDNKDPDKLGRVKVKFPWLPEESRFAAGWARITTSASRSGRGFFWLPEVDDEVLVAFEHGDIRYPIVLGALWNGVDLAPGCLATSGACSCATQSCP